MLGGGVLEGDVKGVEKGVGTLSAVEVVVAVLDGSHGVVDGFFVKLGGVFALEVGGTEAVAELSTC
jgi:hypothetical protein